MSAAEILASKVSRYLTFSRELAVSFSATWVSLQYEIYINGVKIATFKISYLK